MSVVTFQNPGEINMVAATTFGYHDKNTPNAIGYFGTGMKYAIAIVLRLGGSITIYSGTKKHVFGLADPDNPALDFKVITMNKKAQGWTTRMGIKWEVWQAFRELYCNAKDEQGYATNRRLKPEAGKTTIVVEGIEAFTECFEKRSAFFLETNPIVTAAGVEIHNGKSNGIYYRGILVGQFEHNAEFTYNITHPLTLTEDRTLKYSWEPNGLIANAWMKLQDRPQLVERALTSGRESFEGRLGYQTGADPSEQFMDIVSEIRRGPNSGLLNDSAREVHDKFMVGSSRDPEAVAEVLPHEKKALEVALATIARMEVIPNLDAYPIIIVNSLGTGVLGKAHNKRIFLSRRAFEWGQDTLTGTLFEEFCHVALGMADESRDFQNFLINQIARLAGKR